MADEEEELSVDDLDELEEEQSSSEAAAGGATDEDGDPPWGATMTVNETTYAVSLFWQPLQDTNDPFPEVKETVENVMEGADLFCIRQGTSPQYGIGNSVEGHKVGMPSAAAAIADIFSDKSSSVAVFEVDEGWWFIAVRNDLILSEEDILYLNEEDAKRAYYAMMAVPDWGRKIAPAKWEIEGTEEVDLFDILKEPHGSKLVRIDKAHQQKQKIIIGVAALLILIVGYKLISGMFAPAPKKAFRPLAPLKPLEIEEEPLPQVIETKPWEKLIVTEDFLNRCQAGVMQLKYMIVPGWTLGNIQCTPSGLSTEWTMKWGHLGILKRAFEEYGMPGFDYMLSDAGTSAVVSLSLGDLSYHAENPKYTTFEAREEWTNIFQAIKQSISLSNDATRVTVPLPRRSGEEPKSIVKTYNKLLFKFSSDMPMSEWLAVFNQFPALEMQKLEYNIDNGIWSYEGQIYEPSI